MLHLIRAVGRRLLWLSSLLLLAVVFVAFPASPLGQHLRNPIAARSRLATHGCADAQGRHMGEGTPSDRDGNRAMMAGLESSPRWPHSDIEPGHPVMLWRSKCAAAPREGTYPAAASSILTLCSH